MTKSYPNVCPVTLPEVCNLIDLVEAIKYRGFERDLHDLKKAQELLSQGANCLYRTPYSVFQGTISAILLVGSNLPKQPTASAIGSKVAIIADYFEGDFGKQGYIDGIKAEMYVVGFDPNREDKSTSRLFHPCELYKLS